MRPAPKITFRSHRPRGRGGFSLLELIVAMAVMSIIVLTLYSLYDQISDAWGQSKNTVSLYQEANLVLEFLERELKQAVVDPQLGFRVEDEQNPELLLQRAATGTRRFDCDKLYFVSQDVLIEPITHVGAAPFKEVGYEVHGRLDAGNPPFQLRRLTSVKPLAGSGGAFFDLYEKTNWWSSFSEWALWGKHVCGLEVVCWDEEGQPWPQWPPPGKTFETHPAPLMLEVTLSLIDDRTWNEALVAATPEARAELVIPLVRSFTTRVALEVDRE